MPPVAIRLHAPDGTDLDSEQIGGTEAIIDAQRPEKKVSGLVGQDFTDHLDGSRVTGGLYCEVSGFFHAGCISVVNVDVDGDSLAKLGFKAYGKMHPGSKKAITKD